MDDDPSLRELDAYGSGAFAAVVAAIVTFFCESDAQGSLQSVRHAFQHAVGEEGLHRAFDCFMEEALSFPPEVCFAVSVFLRDPLTHAWVSAEAKQAWVICEAKARRLRNAFIEKWQKYRKTGDWRKFLKELFLTKQQTNAPPMRQTIKTGIEKVAKSAGVIKRGGSGDGR